MKKRNLTIFSFVIGILTVCVLVRFALHEHAKKKRAAAYQSDLAAYSRNLRSGVTRKDVEEYVHSQGAQFQRICCTAYQAFEDMTLIGEEDAPWYCGRDDVYLDFQFDGADYSLSDSDRLKRITIVHKLEDCL